MTRDKSTPPEAALVAIDVAKHRNDGIDRKRSASGRKPEA